MAGMVMVTKGGGCGGRRKDQPTADQESQLSVLAFLLAAIRKSVVSCRVDRRDDVVSAVHHLDMEIGWPTDVRHVTHVTFDRFHGFLGLPVEFQVEIPCRVPSASASVFGVSPESMQCSYDSKGNSVPTILLLMQERLYSQGGLKAEGIFRINPENSQEEHVRDRLNKGIVPDDIDVHCLAGLIKAWFRELPAGVLDGLSPEQVLQCNSEEESVDLVKLLMPTQAALLNWAVELMADVVEEEDLNKMNARNIAMVFAPNMTQMADPLTALMHAVQVMNLLKTLIIKTLREREEAASGEEGSWSESTTSSNQQTDDEFDEIKEVDMSCTPEEHDSAEDGETHSQGSSVEIDSLKEIEECFLRQLEDKNELINNDQTMQVSGSDLNESGITVTASKYDSTSTSDAESSGSVMENAMARKRSKEYWRDEDKENKEVQMEPLKEHSLVCLPINPANRMVMQLRN